MRQHLLAGVAINLLLGGTALAQEASSSNDVETIIVTGGRTVNGGGLIQLQEAPKSASAVTRQFIQDQPAAANPFQLINLAPGVNSNGRDPTGTGRSAISVRGFQSNQIGLILDGVPVNDSGNFNVYAQEYIDPENLSQVYIMQGAGDADTPNVGETGGNIGMVVQRPADDFHVTVQQAVGENNLRREYLRVDTGDLGDRTRAFISYSNADLNVWRGEGETKRQHIDASIQHDVGDASRLTLSAFYNTAETYSYQALTKAQIAQYGYNFNFATTWNPITPVPGQVENDNNSAALAPNTSYQRSNYYQLASNPFENLVVSAKANLQMTDDIRLDIQPYLWYGFGGGGTANYVSESNTALLGQATDLNGNGQTRDNLLYYTPYAQQQVRPGVLARGKWTVGINELVVGFQYESGILNEWQPLIAVNQATGMPTDLWPNLNTEHVTRGDGVNARLQNRVTTTEVIRPFAVDTVHLFDDALAVSVGLQHPDINRTGVNNLTLAQRTSGSAVAPVNPKLDQQKFVPSFGVVYHPDEHNELFASITQTFRAADNTVLYTPGVNLGTIQPESTVDTEVGYRYSGPELIGSLAFFNTNYTNRQQSLFDVTANTSVSKNIGGVIIRGVEAEVGTPKFYGFSLYGSGSYTYSRLLNDLQVGVAGQSTPGILPTQGKELTDTPKYIFATLLRYDLDDFFAQMQAKYTGTRYASLTNDEAVSPFTTVDIATGYTLPEAWTGRFQTKAVLSVTNLFDKHYLGGINFGNNARVYNGVPVNLPTYQVGAPRYISAKLQVMY